MLDPTDEIRLLSGHAGRGRDGFQPKLIVCHVQEGTNDLPSYFASLPANGPTAADSTFWCTRDGNLVRMLNDFDTAWTNGSWDTPNMSNPVIADAYRRGIYSGDISLTIEHQGFHNQPFPETQWKATARLVAYWCETFAIPCDRTHIIGHYEVGPHKSCPGPYFPFEQVIEEANNIIRGSSSAGSSPVVTSPAENPDAHEFKETGYWIVNSQDGVPVGFYNYWKRLGLAQLGYPITPLRPPNGTPGMNIPYYHQWTERGRVEYHPESTSAEYKVLEGLTGVETLKLLEENERLRAENTALKLGQSVAKQ